jgi:hypothetical protein
MKQILVLKGITMKTLLKFVITMCLVLVFLEQSVSCQTHERSVYKMKSWKEGKTQIKETRLVVNLNRHIKEYKSVVKDINDKDSYELYISHDPMSKELSESWFISLVKKPGFNFLGIRERPNLLCPYKPGDVGCVISAEDSPGWLYPLENPEFLKHGVLCLPFLAERIIKVEQFYCVIHVIEYKPDPDNPKQLNFLSISIEFTNVEPKRTEQTLQRTRVVGSHSLTFRPSPLNLWLCRLTSGE